MPAQEAMASSTTSNSASNSSRNGRRSFDAIVVGAGVIGLAVGWRAAQRGLSVVVVDGEHPARGATHAAAGMLAPVTEAAFGEEQLLALNLESARAYPGFVAELESEAQMETDYRPSGTLTVALDRDDAELLRRLHRFQLSLGLESQWLRPSECRRLEPSLAPRLAGGMRTEVDHQVDPRRLAAALGAALERAGGTLLANAPVLRLTTAEGAVTGVELNGGERLEADRVVVAAGWRSGELAGLPERARVPVRPVKGQILRLRATPGAALPRRVVRTPEVYLVPRAGGEVVVGATVEELGPDVRVTAGGVLDLLRAAYRAVPAVAELELVETLAGLRPASPDNRPVVGRGALDGLIWATGHWRNGVLLAPTTARAVAGLLAGEELPGHMAPFAPDRFGAGVPAPEAVRHET